MKILSSQGLDTLRFHLYSKPNDVCRDFEQLASELALKFVELPIDVKSTGTMKLSGSKNQSVSDEVQNVLIVRDSLGKLTPLLALDERLWVTLTLSQYREYFVSRWFDGSGNDEAAVKSLDNHLFATTSRRFIRDQAISRLWWAGKIASDLKGVDENIALETMFWNSELLSQITSRPTTASSSALTGEVIRIMHERKSQNLNFERDKFRKLMATIDLTLGRNLVFALPADVLRAKVVQIAESILNN